MDEPYAADDPLTAHKLIADTRLPLGWRAQRATPGLNRPA